MNKYLQPCPFCGGKATIHRHTMVTDLSHTYSVECTQCGVETKSFYTRQEQAAEAWNRREEPWKEEKRNFI